jgi:AhpD family alkylhydroperoxidase
MKRLILASVAALFAPTAWAQEAPQFLQKTYPEYALNSALGDQSVLRGAGAKLDAKTRELIPLAVAAQIPRSYCVNGHMKAARAKCASEEEEIREAVATAADVREWSTVLNGMEL